MLQFHVDTEGDWKNAFYQLFGLLEANTALRMGFSGVLCLVYTLLQSVYYYNVCFLYIVISATLFSVIMKAIKFDLLEIFK